MSVDSQPNLKIGVIPKTRVFSSVARDLPKYI